jgi:hypothetical protein
MFDHCAFIVREGSITFEHGEMIHVVAAVILGAVQRILRVGCAILPILGIVIVGFRAATAFLGRAGVNSVTTASVVVGAP